MYKIIIADDEEIECRALELMIKNGLRDCCVLDSVYNGFELIKAVDEQKPDIAIVDLNMPGMKGLEAIELIRMKNKEIKIVINTAYSDFEYIKKAMSCHVFEYVLKPVKRAELYSVLNKICRVLDEEKKAKEDSSRFVQMEIQMGEIARNHIMTSLLLGEWEEESFQVFLNSLNIPFMGGVMAAICEVGDRKEGEKFEEIQRLFDRELSRSTGYLKKYFDSILYYYIVPGVKKEEFEEWFLEEMSLLQRLAKTERGIELKIGVSRWKNKTPETPQALRECLYALKAHNEPGIYFFREEERGKKGLYQDRFDVIKKLFQEKREHELGEVFHKSMALAKQQQISVEEWRRDTAACMMELLYTEEERATENYVYRKKDWSFCIQEKDFLEAEGKMIQILSEEVEKIGGRITNPYIIAALQYMENHYSEDLSLDKTAESVHITSFYLSRLFKQELNLNFIDIVTDIRMKKAFQLLRSEKYNIRQISEKTGYTSLSYFYKVFKKYFGITAGEMRTLF